MQLSQFTDFGLRTLLFLGAHTDRVVTLGEVADAYGISLNHLRKVAQELTRLGYVDVVRGPTGGYRLAINPQDVTIGQIVRSIEPNMALVACFPGHSGHCVISPLCQLKPMLNEALTAFLAALDRYTLADCLVRRNDLTRLFLPPGSAPPSEP